MAESALQRLILLDLEARGFFVLKVVAANKAGNGDIVACSPEGRFYMIEVKDNDKKARELQEYKISEVCKRGGVAFWCDSFTVYKHEIEKQAS